MNFKTIEFGMSLNFFFLFLSLSRFMMIGKVDDDFFNGARIDPNFGYELTRIIKLTMTKLKIAIHVFFFVSSLNSDAFHGDETLMTFDDLVVAELP